MNYQDRWEEWKEREIKENLSLPYLQKRYGAIVAPFMKEYFETAPLIREYETPDYVWEVLEERFHGFVPVWVQELFVEVKGEMKHFLPENLKTYSTELFVQKLTDKFGGVAYPGNISGVGDWITWYPKDSDLYWKVIKDFRAFQKKGTTFELQSFADFYGYYISQLGDSWIGFGSKYSQDMNEFVDKACNGKAYHVCRAENLESILKTGLRAKNGMSSYMDGGKRVKMDILPYRYFPKRVHLYAKPRTTEEDLVRLAYRLGLSDPDDRAFLEVDVHGIDLYQDTAMMDFFSLYTHQNIPASRIKVAEF